MRRLLLAVMAVGMMTAFVGTETAQARGRVYVRGGPRVYYSGYPVRYRGYTRGYPRYYRGYRYGYPVRSYYGGSFYRGGYYGGYPYRGYYGRPGFYRGYGGYGGGIYIRF